LRNSHGASEFLAMGWECGHARMHLNTDWLLLEPVDERQRLVPAGEVSQSVLLNTAPCRCGSPLPTIEVVGRHGGIWRLRGSQDRPVALLPLALSTVMEETAGVFDFQIVQRDDHTLVVRLPEQGDAGKQALARCRSALMVFASEHGVVRLRVLGELGRPVPRGRSGKACRVQVKSG
jgi:phenylacetate-CoA ligase